MKSLSYGLLLLLGCCFVMGCGGPAENTVKPARETPSRDEMQQHYQDASKPQK